MNSLELASKIKQMLESEFLNKEEMTNVNEKVDAFIKDLNDDFGYNDGEPLEEDGIKFVVELITLKWKLVNAVVDENGS